MSNYIKYELHLDRRAARLELNSVGWPQFKAFFDAFTRALAAMPDGVPPQQVLPLELRSGSVAPVVHLPIKGRTGLDRLQRGPDETWTGDMIQGAWPLWRYLREQDMVLDGRYWRGRRRRRFNVPDPRAPWAYCQLETARGRVFRVGGQLMKAEVQFELDRRLECSFSGGPTEVESIIRRMASCLYQVVEIEGLATRNGKTSQLLDFVISSFDPAQDRHDPSTFAGSVSAVTADAEFDPEGFMEEIR